MANPGQSQTVVSSAGETKPAGAPGPTAKPVSPSTVGNKASVTVSGGDQGKQHKVKSLRPINEEQLTTWIRTKKLLRKMKEKIYSKIETTAPEAEPKPESEVKFPKFRFYDRFHHSWLEVRREITDSDGENKDEKSDEKKEDSIFSQPPSAMVRSLTEVQNEEWRDLKRENYTNEKALQTKKSGDYTYFEPGNKRRRIAFFDGKLKRVSKINTCEETFHIVFHFYATWLMSYNEVLRMKAAMKENNGEVKDDWKPKSYPQFEVCNKVDGEMKQVGKFQLKDGKSWPKKLGHQNPENDFKYWYDENSGFDINPKQLGFYPLHAYYCRVQYECQFTCAEEMELEMFPFDCQDLSTYLRLQQKANEWDVLPLPRHGEIFNTNARFSMVSEWKIPGVLLEFEQGDPKAAKDGIGYNSVIIRVKAERKWQSHLKDSFVIFGMFWLGLATFGIPVEEVGDRLAYCITLLLTDVASMQLLNEGIPNIPYRTFLDSYTFSCFGYLVGITTWVTFTGWHGSPSLGHNKDWIAFGIFASFAVLIHVYFIVRVWLAQDLEQSKLTRDSKGLEDYFNYMSHVSSMRTAGVYWDSHTIEKIENEDKNEEENKEDKDKEIGAWSALSYPWEGYPEDEVLTFSK